MSCHFLFWLIYQGVKIFSSIHMRIVWIGNEHILSFFFHLWKLSFFTNKIPLIILLITFIILQAHSVKKLNSSFSFSHLFVYGFLDILQITNHFNTFFHLGLRLFGRVLLSSGKFYVFMRNGDIAWSMLETESSEVARRGINNSFALIEGSPFLLFLYYFISSFFLLFLFFIRPRINAIFLLAFTFPRLFILFIILFFLLILRARIINHFDLLNKIVSHSNEMNFAVHSIAWASNIPIKLNVDSLIPLIIPILCCLPAIDQNIWMVESP